jgi:hypothetical protein
LGIYDNETFIRQIYFDFIEGKSRSSQFPDKSFAWQTFSLLDAAQIPRPQNS